MPPRPNVNSVIEMNWHCETICTVHTSRKCSIKVESAKKQYRSSLSCPWGGVGILGSLKGARLHEGVEMGVDGSDICRVFFSKGLQKRIRVEGSDN